MKYCLLFCWFGGNKSLAEVQANNKDKAVELLQSNCPVKLDKYGYAKSGEITYCVGEVFGS